ncbi:hypothetical protein [Halomonas korlensis]|uniref:Uncharacterized protein n=1 Tax=Halomonas korlensis TaxID=463301 RepID=A0A1I7J324_9GAMM|nr:hypothetical protein [Halomonas korlensis]SFU79583.1 hypothetical protein SAMN04487955_10923 [Halomonas korlensis]
MLDSQYMKDLLQSLNDGGYVGVKNDSLWHQFVGDDDDQQGQAHKFVYHMDELYGAGLMRQRSSQADGWGHCPTLSGNFDIASVPLVLTPLGQELLEELNKPKGLERFKQALRSAGATAGTEAVRYATGAMLSGGGAAAGLA